MSDQSARLLDCGFCYEEQGEEVHPHPECPVGPSVDRATVSRALEELRAGNHITARLLLESAMAQQPETQTANDESLVHVGWWCWRGDNHGHLATMACRSDNVPIHVPTEWADEMRAVIQRLENGDDEEQPEASAEPEALPLLFWDEPAGVVYKDGRITAWLSKAVSLAHSLPAGQLILQPEAGARLRRTLTTALNDAVDEAQQPAADPDGCTCAIAGEEFRPAGHYRDCPLAPVAAPQPDGEA